MKLTITLFVPCKREPDYKCEFYLPNGELIKFRGKTKKLQNRIDYTEAQHDEILLKLEHMGILDQMQPLKEQTIITYSDAKELLYTMLYYQEYFKENVPKSLWVIYRQIKNDLAVCIAWHGVLVFSNNKIRRSKNEDDTRQD
jgi:hypothetical protein